MDRQALYEELRAINNGEHFDPAKLVDLRRVIYGNLGAPVSQRTVLGAPSVCSDALRALATAETPYGKFAGKILVWRELAFGRTGAVAL